MGEGTAVNHDLERGGAAAPKLLDQVRQQIRVRHYSRRTEDSYVDWVRRFVLFHRKRHPRDMGKPEIEASLRHLAADFVHWYNVEHRHSGIQYVSPAQRHSGDDRAVQKLGVRSANVAPMVRDDAINIRGTRG